MPGLVNAVAQILKISLISFCHTLHLGLSCWVGLPLWFQDGPKMVPRWYHMQTATCLFRREKKIPEVQVFLSGLIGQDGIMVPAPPPFLNHSLIREAVLLCSLD